MAVGKTIAVFSDGTGNSSAKLFKTNVWRTYQALDLTSNPPSGQPRQVAYYDDGVGTSTFRPLTLLGGILGVGLKRNVLDLYKFLCRNYRPGDGSKDDPGDRIYAFGFSRGAFTIRLLVGFVARQGLLTDLSEGELNRLAPEAYRMYRRESFKGNRLVALLRGLRDQFTRGKRAAVSAARTEVKEIEFVGVWDTVGAYGTPIAELTRGIDKWIWPLWFTDYTLTPKVKKACHALALDDERDTFHPLIWDEASETQASRLQQVWFVGMHSDVGGGYPDDALAFVSLDWMMEEAAAAGARFKPAAAAEVKRTLSETAPIHDSRRGVAAYYRYQPRKIGALLASADPTALLMRDPNEARRPVLRSVRIHESVIRRIRSGTDAYAPIVLPPQYTVVGTGGSVTPAPESDAARSLRADKHKWVWNYVWKRRVNYFVTLAVSLALVALPAIHWFWKPEECVGFHCGLSDIVLKAGELLPLPTFLSGWFKALAAAPGWLLVAVVAIFLLLRRAGALQTRIEDRMRALWTQRSEGLALLGRDESSLKESVILRLRSSAGYQRAFQFLKWSVLPNVFGAALLGALMVLVAFIPHRLASQIAEAYVLCRGTVHSADQPFHTGSVCWKAPGRVAREERYRLSLTVEEEWWDRQVRVIEPTGLTAGALPYGIGYWAAPFRRSLTSRWFQPLVKIVSDNRAYSIIPLEMRRSQDGYTAEFVAPRGGDLYLFVNDVTPIRGLTQWSYSNNRGTARATVTRVPPRTNPGA